MRNFMCGLVIVGASLVGLVRPASAQGFEEGYTDVGAVVGLGGINGAGLAVGGRVEKGVKTFSSGVLGIQGAFDWYHYSYHVGSVDFGTITVLPISVTANYHFKLSNGKLDPFLGAGLGYERVSWSCGSFDCSGAVSSGVYGVVRAGVRYFMTPKAALYVDAGAGAATLDVGVTFKLN